MAKLVIVESPAKAKTINKYLGKGYQVRASMGHVRDLPKSKMGVDIKNDFTPTYVISPDRKKTITELKKLSKSADEVFLATDLDREGEAIAWHLAEALKLPAEKTRRVVFNEITKNAIKDAFSHAGEINLKKVNAQQARRILDRVVGYELSPLLWKKVRRGLSAGRVQSVAVRLIVDREREIEAFKPEEYWEIEAKLAKMSDEQGFSAKLKRLTSEKSETVAKDDTATHLLSNETSARSLVEEIETLPFVLTKLDQKERVAAAPPPFITSTLQQQASIQLHFRTRKTMVIAQQLYEGVELGAEGSVGLITYMRTDSFHISNQAIADCRDFISKAYPAELPAEPLRYRSGKDAQGAHEAIRPTSVELTPEKVQPFLERDQFRLYELIWKRFVASQMNPAKIAVTDIEVTAGRAVFGVQGKRLIYEGHYKVSGFDAKSEVLLPELSEGEVLKLLEPLDPTQHFTKPPPRYSEASLVKTLEKLGIGRPSTYAPIISTIQQRKYVLLEKRQFHASELGKIVTDQLVQHFADIMDVKFTSQMEDRLDQVEEGSDWVQALKEFYGPFAADLEKAGENMKRPEPEMTEYKCEKCGEPMLKRWSTNGYFLGCSAYPKCRSTMPLDEEGKPAPRPEPEQTEEKCEKCGSPMVIRTGRFGKFIACSDYPKCKTSRSLEQAAVELPEDMKTCDKCGKPMAVRRSRRGPFIGCTGYPDCKNAKPMPK